ncbi:MAG: peptidoglycan bridge formation glycyltransferase FemA/FemB family protein [Schaalia hyovaginalis]|uniref:lipid II:glycine glycyltransferase FemX n=1 Tax=Schaalia hyovaginalis TaxID=29316 RepID=UPI002A90CC58|nr:GNAT family N-acetyltransferase [Schaalia hyovaginalis]MDY6214889.1 peptidoglycan bridge formation glycyltransferase FemA/FemB family protein [Schaalia hyovaginalis]
MTAVTRIVELSADEMRCAASGVGGLPIEQSEHWELFARRRGSIPTARIGWFEGDKCAAVLALYEHRIRHWRYLWAKNGPVWIKEPTPEREAALRVDLARWLRSRDRGILFVRLHAWYRAGDLHDLLQTLTFDRTIVIDCSGGTEDTILETMTSDGRRRIRRSRAKAEKTGSRISEETGISPEGFEEFYAVLDETAKRDGFRQHPKEVYLDLLEALGPDHARLFASRDASGAILSWDLVLTNGKRAQVEYGASSERGRALGATQLLDLEVAIRLAAEGFEGLDLRGVHSPRVPELFSVGKYKRSFASHYTDVAGAWDMPLSNARYAFVRTLLAAKRRLVAPKTLD